MWSRHSAADNYDYDANLKFNFSCANVYIHNPSNGLVVIKHNNSIFRQPPLNIHLERLSNYLCKQVILISILMTLRTANTSHYCHLAKPAGSLALLQKWFRKEKSWCKLFDRAGPVMFQYLCRSLDYKGRARPPWR